jgi:hypothetical protein
MRAKMYEKYYKRGFNHLMFKEVFHLKKPKTETKIMYIGILFVIVVAAVLLS